MAKKISVSDGVKSDVAKESRIAQCCVCRCLPQLDQRIYPTPDPLNEIIKDEPEQHQLHHLDNESAFYWDFLHIPCPKMCAMIGNSCLLWPISLRFVRSIIRIISFIWLKTAISPNQFYSSVKINHIY